jgi:hypothetical protein
MLAAVISAFQIPFSIKLFIAKTQETVRAEMHCFRQTHKVNEPVKRGRFGRVFASLNSRCVRKFCTYGLKIVFRRSLFWVCTVQF